MPDLHSSNGQINQKIEDMITCIYSTSSSVPYESPSSPLVHNFINTIAKNFLNLELMGALLSKYKARPLNVLVKILIDRIMEMASGQDEICLRAKAITNQIKNGTQDMNHQIVAAPKTFTPK